jgi:thiol-disulfide isomerase/thioredoxin
MRIFALAFLPAVTLGLGTLKAVDLHLRELNGPERSLQEYVGKAVVLNFWATWCEPCRDEMPLFVAAHKRYSASGLVIIGASADEESTQAHIPAFLRRMRIEFPIWTGATTEHMQRLELGEGLPVTAFIDRNGQIVSRILGPVTKAELEQRIDYLLGGGGPAPAPLIDRITTAIKDGKHKEEEKHTHGSVGLEGASTVPS